MKNFVRNTAAALLIGATALGLGAGTAGAETPGMHGDPIGASQWSSAQNYDDCAIMATAHVVGMLTGNMPAENDIVAVAGSIPSGQHDGPIYVVNTSDDPTAGGTDPGDLPKLLGHYGINATYTDNEVAAAGGPATGLPALENYLDSGRAVIVSIDANPVWGLPEDGNGGHAVVVTGVDTVGGFVHLNDSGIGHGADEPVTISTFQAAWDYSDQGMVVTG